MDPSNKLHIFSSVNASMEEVCSPTEQRNSFLSHHPHLPSSSSTPTLAGVSTSPYAGLSSPSPAWRLTQPTYATPDQRPTSAAGGSLFTAHSYSTISSDASSALTYPSPGSSKVELHVRHRLSGQHARLANAVNGSTDSSPTGATFGSVGRTNGVDASGATALNAMQFGGWTHEQITEPNVQTSRLLEPSTPSSQYVRSAIADHQPAQPPLLASAMPDETASSRTHIRSSSLPLQDSPFTASSRKRRDPTAAESVRDQALHALNGQGTEWERNTDPMALSRDGGMSNTSTPPLKSVPSLGTLSQSSSSEPGLLAGLKKRLLLKRNGGAAKKALRTADQTRSAGMKEIEERTNGLDLNGQEASSEAFDDAHGYDTRRRPSLPHLGTMPTITKTRRLSMQSTQRLHPHHLSIEAQETLTEGRASNSNADFPSRHRRPSVDSVVQRLFKQPENKPHTRSATHSRSSSRTSVIEHTSFEDAKRRSGIFSHGFPDHIASHSIRGPSNYVMEDAREELKGDAGSSQFSGSEGGSVVSIRSASNVPSRPPRQDEGETYVRTSTDSSSINARPSLESMFNAAHNRRWSTVGPAFSTHGRHGSESNASSFGPFARRGSDVTNPNQFAPGSFSSGTTSPRHSFTSGHGAPVSGQGGLFSSSSARFEMHAGSLPQSDSYAAPVMNAAPVAMSASPSSNKTRARRSFVEPAANRLSSFIRAGITRKRSLADTSISRPAALVGSSPGVRTDNFLMTTADTHAAMGTEDASSPAADSFSRRSSSANRSSEGASSTHNEPLGGVGMRPSRSTNDLLDRSAKLHGASSTSLVAAHIIPTPKRPTFGLDLQPDAAAAFDSIPLPATPERSRSRTSSLQTSLFASPSGEQLALPPAVMVSSEVRVPTTADVGGDHHLHGHVVDALSVPDDLPADVEDFEDLLDDEADNTIGDDTLRAPLPSGMFGSPSADEVELLEDDDGFSQDDRAADDVLPDAALGKLAPSPSSSIAHTATQHGSQRAIGVPLSAYRFPARPDEEQSIPLSEKMGTSPIHSISLPVHGEDIGSETDLPLHARRRTSASLQSMSPTPPPARLVAAHLRRPSSSASYV